MEQKIFVKPLSLVTFLLQENLICSMVKVMVKYKQFYREMVEEHQDDFDLFKTIHDNYIINPDAWQDKFNNEGKRIVEIIRIWERKLCQHSEKGQYGKYSAGLAEKFWNEVRLHYPKIDFVGVVIS